jgi:hypothetical protein
MSWSIRCTAFVTLFILPVAVPAQAHSGVWTTFSAGRGAVQVNCNICRGAEQSSWAADVAVGAWAGPRTTLGGELAAWRLGGEEATQRVMLVSVIGQRYPFKLPAFVKLGVGVMNYSSTDGEASLAATSLALQAGVGVDIPVAGRYIAVPHAMFVQGVNGGLYLDDTRVTGWSRVRLLRLGLGVGMGR